MKEPNTMLFSRMLYEEKKQDSCPQKLQCVKCYEKQHFGSTGEYVEEEEKIGIFKAKMGRKGQ